MGDFDWFKFRGCNEDLELEPNFEHIIYFNWFQNIFREKMKHTTLNIKLDTRKKHLIMIQTFISYDFTEIDSYVVLPADFFQDVFEICMPTQTFTQSHFMCGPIFSFSTYTRNKL